MQIETSDLHTIQEASYDEETGCWRVVILADGRQLDPTQMGPGEFTLVEREIQILIERFGGRGEPELVVPEGVAV